MSGSALDGLPGAYPLLAAVTALARRPAMEWRASPLARALAAWPRPEGLAADPHDLRPADAEAGRRILAGGFRLGGESLAPGPRGDPWGSPSPSRRFAELLHGFGWLKDLTVLGDAGSWEGLRLTLAWARLFGRWNGFAWSGEVLERRVFNVACAIRALTAPASEAEADQIAADLARQARTLLSAPEGPVRAAERATAAAVAGAALGGPGGEQLLDRALGRLVRALPQTVTPDGGHATRSPRAALELFFDLTTLDGALVQRGIAAPDEMMRALDRLAATVRFFTLADGALASFQGGAEASASYVAAARAQDELGERATPAARNGYHRLGAAALQVIVDGAEPAAGAWSVDACAQPLAMAVFAAGKPLVVNSGWSAAAHAPQALRLVDAASTAAVGEAACGAPLSGFAAQVLGHRLRDAAGGVEAQRQEEPGAMLLELSHDGWVRRFGLRHERRLHLDRASGELRGEDRLTPLRARAARDGRRFVPFTVRFHLHPLVSALIARDRKSVLLKVEGDETGWWLRNDAAEVRLDASTQLHDGEVRHGQQIVLRGQARLDAGARIRWKIGAAHSLSEAERVDVVEAAS